MPTNEKLPPDGYELGPGWTLKLKRHWFCTAGDGRCPYSATYGYQKRGSRSGAGACHVHAETMGAIVRKAAPVCCPRGCKGLNGQHEVFCPGNDETRAANAIVRKAEAPTFEQAIPGETAALGVLGMYAVSLDDQPSGNPGEFPPRCEVCCWPLARSRDKGCVPGDCSYRPEDPRELAKWSARRAWIAAGRPPEQPSRNPLQLPPEAPAAPVGEPPRHQPADCPLNKHLHPDNRGRTDLCGDCFGANPKLEKRDARIAALEAELAEAKRGTLVVAETAYGATQAAVQAERERCAAAFHRHWNSDDFCAADCEAEIRNGDPKP